MSSYNKVFLIGNLGKDPEFRTTQAGEVCNFSIATTKYRKGKDALTYWHDVSAWWSLAEAMKKLGLSKGDSVHVDGELTYREHEGKKYTQIYAVGIQLLSSKEKKQESAEVPQDDEQLPF